MASRNKAKEKRAGLKIQQIDDLNATLEHLIAVGASVQQEQQRRDDFVLSMQQPLEQQHQRWVQQPPATDERAPKKQRVHVEDIRIYGESGAGRRGFQRCPWPERSKLAPSERLDDKWNAEHGDTVHPIAFSKARLSGKRPSSQADADIINGSNLHLSTTDVTLSTEQVPRALLLRCWERAVHASSCYVTSNWSEVYHQETGDDVLGLGEPESFGFATKATKTLERPPYIVQNDIVASDPKATQEKCKSLKLDLKQTNGSSTCPICTRAFNTFHQMQEHYYGNGKEKGCCWHRVSDEQSQVVAGIFEAHTMNQVDGFLSVLLREAKRRNESGTEEENGNNNKRRRLLNWYDVLKIGEKVMEDAKKTVSTSPTGAAAASSHPVLETYLPANGSGGLPLTLNPTVLATVRERLIQRYSDTPL